MGGARGTATLFDPAKGESIELPSYALRSGPRKTIYHSPKDVTAAIVTCARAAGSGVSGKRAAAGESGCPHGAAFL